MAVGSENIARDRALYWLDRWDRQQEYYLPEREERFAVIADLLEICLPRPDALVVDLGIGPGSLSHRLLSQFDQIRIVGVDEDPLLLALADAAYGSDRLRTVRADLRSSRWFESLGLDRAPDAFVSTTALHWLDRGPLRDLLRTCAREIAPGGVFVNADHLYEGSRGPRLDDVLRTITAHRSARVRQDRTEDWTAWWEAVEQAPELAAAVRERDGGFDHTVTDRPSVYDYLSSLREGGFAEAGTAWQVGDDRVLVALAPAGGA